MLNAQVAEAATPDESDDEAATSGVDEEAMKAYRAQLTGEMEVVNEMFAQWRGNFSLFKANLATVTEVVRAVADAKSSALPKKVSALMTDNAVTESADTVDDLMRVISTDSTALKKGLSRIKKALDA